VQRALQCFKPKILAGALRSQEDNFVVEHDLFGKPVPTFPDHALATSRRKIDLSALWSTVLGDAKPAGDDRRGLPSVAMLE